MYQVGIDIGSSAAKAAVIKDGEIIKTLLLSTGFSSRKTADEIYEALEKDGITKENAKYVATGYGRISVPYADRSVTEITCHGKGAWFLFGKNGTVIDIGGQDTKGIALKNGRVMKFIMNDKCSAGTGKFLEVISLIGKGTPREDIANGVIESVVSKVVSLISQVPEKQYFLTGGLCEDEYIVGRLAHVLGAPVESSPMARYAGAIGAAIMAGDE